MKIFKFKYMASAAVIALSSLGMTSCVGDLDVDNINPQQVSELNTDALFNKVYSNMVLTGQVGPNGSGDLDDIDEGTSSMIRQLWNANELTTDEAKCVWGDAGIPEFNHNSWSDNHPMTIVSTSESHYQTSSSRRRRVLPTPILSPCVQRCAS